MSKLPLPSPDRESALAFVSDHLAHLVCDDVVGSPSYRGGQTSADAALAAFDVAGYARKRNEVHPAGRRGASGLSPYIRHGLLQLAEVWAVVADGPSKDVQKFRDELLWQEFARHWYAHHGTATQRGIRRELEPGPGSMSETDMDCLAMVRNELETDGWLVNQTRMWFSSHWAVRNGEPWRNGEDYFFQHLLDGSRAANRLGWQWTTGVGSSKSYGFSRWQVEKRAPGLCESCALRTRCPIQDWPDDPAFVASSNAPAQPVLTGPSVVEAAGAVDHVWLTAESLGDADPALSANRELPVVFVFDEPLLASLRLSSKRLVFLTETLADLGTRRTVELRLGTPSTELDGLSVAVTWAPVPGFARRIGGINAGEVHPFPWLRQPNNKAVSSFSSWRRNAERNRPPQ